MKPLFTAAWVAARGGIQGSFSPRAKGELEVGRGAPTIAEPGTGAATGLHQSPSRLLKLFSPLPSSFLLIPPAGSPPQQPGRQQGGSMTRPARARQQVSSAQGASTPFSEARLAAEANVPSLEVPGSVNSVPSLDRLADTLCFPGAGPELMPLQGWTGTERGLISVSTSVQNSWTQEDPAPVRIPMPCGTSLVLSEHFHLLTPAPDLFLSANVYTWSSPLCS